MTCRPLEKMTKPSTGAFDFPGSDATFKSSQDSCNRWPRSTLYSNIPEKLDFGVGNVFASSDQSQQRPDNRLSLTDDPVVWGMLRFGAD